MDSPAVNRTGAACELESCPNGTPVPQLAGGAGMDNRGASQTGTAAEEKPHVTLQLHVAAQGRQAHQHDEVNSHTSFSDAETRATRYERDLLAHQLHASSLEKANLRAEIRQLTEACQRAHAAALMAQQEVASLQQQLAHTQAEAAATQAALLRRQEQLEALVQQAQPVASGATTHSQTHQEAAAGAAGDACHSVGVDIPMRKVKSNGRLPVHASPTALATMLLTPTSMVEHGVAEAAGQEAALDNSEVSSCSSYVSVSSVEEEAGGKAASDQSSTSDLLTGLFSDESDKVSATEQQQTVVPPATAQAQLVPQAPVQLQVSPGAQRAVRAVSSNVRLPVVQEPPDSTSPPPAYSQPGSTPFTVFGQTQTAALTGLAESVPEALSGAMTPAQPATTAPPPPSRTDEEASEPGMPQLLPPVHSIDSQQNLAHQTLLTPAPVSAPLAPLDAPTLSRAPTFEKEVEADDLDMLQPVSKVAVQDVVQPVAQPVMAPGGGVSRDQSWEAWVAQTASGAASPADDHSTCEPLPSCSSGVPQAHVSASGQLPEASREHSSGVSGSAGVSMLPVGAMAVQQQQQQQAVEADVVPRRSQTVTEGVTVRHQAEVITSLVAKPWQGSTTGVSTPSKYGSVPPSSEQQDADVIRLQLASISRSSYDRRRSMGSREGAGEGQRLGAISPAASVPRLASYMSLPASPQVGTAAQWPHHLQTRDPASPWPQLSSSQAAGSTTAAATSPGFLRAARSQMQLTSSRGTPVSSETDSGFQRRFQQVPAMMEGLSWQTSTSPPASPTRSTRSLSLTPAHFLPHTSEQPSSDSSALDQQPLHDAAEEEGARQLQDDDSAQQSAASTSSASLSPRKSFQPSPVSTRVFPSHGVQGWLVHQLAASGQTQPSSLTHLPPGPALVRPLAPRAAADVHSDATTPTTASTPGYPHTWRYGLSHASLLDQEHDSPPAREPHRLGRVGYPETATTSATKPGGRPGLVVRLPSRESAHSRAVLPSGSRRVSGSPPARHSAAGGATQPGTHVDGGVGHPGRQDSAGGSSGTGLYLSGSPGGHHHLHYHHHQPSQPHHHHHHHHHHPDQLAAGSPSSAHAEYAVPSYLQPHHTSMHHAASTSMLLGHRPASRPHPAALHPLTSTAIAPESSLRQVHGGLSSSRPSTYASTPYLPGAASRGVSGRGTPSVWPDLHVPHVSSGAAEAPTPHQSRLLDSLHLLQALESITRDRQQDLEADLEHLASSTSTSRPASRAASLTGDTVQPVLDETAVEQQFGGEQQGDGGAQAAGDVQQAGGVQQQQGAGAAVSGASSSDEDGVDQGSSSAAWVHEAGSEHDDEVQGLSGRPRPVQGVAAAADPVGGTSSPVGARACSPGSAGPTSTHTAASDQPSEGQPEPSVDDASRDQAGNAADSTAGVSGSTGDGAGDGGDSSAGGATETGVRRVGSEPGSVTSYSVMSASDQITPPQPVTAAADAGWIRPRALPVPDAGLRGTRLHDDSPTVHHLGGRQAGGRAGQGEVVEVRSGGGVRSPTLHAHLQQPGLRHSRAVDGGGGDAVREGGDGRARDEGSGGGGGVVTGAEAAGVRAAGQEERSMGGGVPTAAGGGVSAAAAGEHDERQRQVVMGEVYGGAGGRVRAAGEQAGDGKVTRETQQLDVEQQEKEKEEVRPHMIRSMSMRSTCRGLLSEILGQPDQATPETAGSWDPFGPAGESATPAVGVPAVLPVAPQKQVQGLCEGVPVRVGAARVLATPTAHAPLYSNSFSFQPAKPVAVTLVPGTVQYLEQQQEEEGEEEAETTIDHSWAAAATNSATALTPAGSVPEQQGSTYITPSSHLIAGVVTPSHPVTDLSQSTDASSSANQLLSSGHSFSVAPASLLTLSSHGEASDSSSTEAGRKPVGKPITAARQVLFLAPTTAFSAAGGAGGGPRFNVAGITPGDAQVTPGASSGAEQPWVLRTAVAPGRREAGPFATDQLADIKTMLSAMMSQMQCLQAQVSNSAVVLEKLQHDQLDLAQRLEPVERQARR